LLCDLPDRCLLSQQKEAIPSPHPMGARVRGRGDCMHTEKNPAMKTNAASQHLYASILSALLALGLSAGAADVPRPLAGKGKQLFADNFDRAELGAWRSVIPTFTTSDGVLKGSQTRADHGAVSRVKVGFKDAIIECKFRFEGATGFNVVFDDKAHKGSHAGHICRVAVAPRQIRLGDDKEGVMRNDIFEMRKDPRRKAEADKLLAGRTQAVPVKLEQRRWYRLSIEIVGEQMRVSLDDKPIGYLKSPGIGHATKAEFGFTVSGKDAHFDDVRVFAAEQKTR